MSSMRFKNKSWFRRYRDNHGQEREMRLPFGKGQKRLAEIRMAELDAKDARVRDGLERIEEKLTLAELWRRFEPIARQKRSWKSIEGRWRNHILPALGAMDIHAIEPADIEALMAKKEAGGLSPQTAEHIRVHLAAAYTFAIRKLRIFRGENPARIADRPIIPPPRILFLDVESMDRLLAAVPERWAGIFAVSAYTGMRKGEVLGLQLGDVDLGRSKLYVGRSYDQKTTKGNKGRMVGFPPPLLPHLRRAMARALGLGSTWLFGDRAGKVRTQDTKLTEVLRKALKAAGIEAPAGFSYKSLRSSFATHLAETTGDLQAVQMQLGHSSPTLTAKHYAVARDRHLVAQVARLPYGLQPSAEGIGVTKGIGVTRAEDLIITPIPAHAQPTNVVDPDQTQPASTEPS